MRNLPVVWTCVAAALIGVGGCGFQPEEPQADGNEIRFVSGAPVDTLDPQGTSWLVDFRVIEGLFEPLLKVNPATLKLEPAAAEAVVVLVCDDSVGQAEAKGDRDKPLQLSLMLGAQVAGGGVDEDELVVEDARYAHLRERGKAQDHRLDVADREPVG